MAAIKFNVLSLGDDHFYNNVQHVHNNTCKCVLLTLGACEARDEGYGSLSVYLCVCVCTCVSVC